MADHPITPPPELFTGWLSEALLDHDAKSGTVAAMVADRAAQWGADQELEACLWHLESTRCNQIVITTLRAARRPKPLTPAEKALVQYDRFIDMTKDSGRIPAGCIRAALERLAELEAQQ